MEFPINKQQKTLHIYARVSSEEQFKKGYSIDIQVKLGIERAKQLGYKYKIYREEGKSANYENTLNRPQLALLLSLCEKNEVDTIFITDMDRLSRNMRLVLDIEKIIIKHGITLITLSQTIDLKDPDQHFQAMLLAMMAEHENTKRVRKIKHSLAAAVRKGRWIGALIPYGYRKGDDGILEIDPEEEKVYKMIVEQTMKGKGTNSICKELNRLNIQTRGSKVLKNGIQLSKNNKRYTDRHIAPEDIQWASNTIRSIIINPIYKGERQYKGQTIYAPAIIDSETWDQLQMQHKKNKNHSTTSRKHFYLLKGLLRCGCCGRNLYGRIKPNAKNPEYYYLCSSKRITSCGLRSINIPLLNTVVWQQVIGTSECLKHLLENLKGTNDTEKIEDLRKMLASLKRETSQLEKRKKNLLLLFETERIDMMVYDNREAEINLEIQNNKEELSRISKEVDNLTTIENRIVETISDMEQIQDQLLKLEEKEKQDILYEIIENITIHWVPDFQFHIVNIEFNFNGIRYKTSKVVPVSPKSRKAIIETGKTKPAITVELVYSADSDYGLKSVG
ncbi:MAG: recombinase family protein [Flavobacteriales bacterium]|nr:recombinase family protein [Flavobacteriales bacterium]MCW8912884.1 recombinase family protein [Flavobacteriales bacterium]MCW8937233.1 recombinase family protein [Flavobacteriales bacterium]MCW8940086.1 recombinase family protein [Flavobacteriales bacterium]MCW8967806.1 recombinase family protein [Flavobacteriales bacterium]